MQDHPGGPGVLNHREAPSTNLGIDALFAMWTWSLNWGEITPRVIIGTCPMTPDDLKRVKAGVGVSAVMSLQHDQCLVYWGIEEAQMRHAGAELGLVMVRRPIRDFDIPDMRRHLPDAIAMLAHLQAAGHRTYVHCTAGMSRAPLTVLGYLTLVEGYTPEVAIRLILAGRAEAVPAWEAYHGCLEDLVKRHREAIERRAYELCEQGFHSDADADWNQAQAEVLRTLLTSRRIVLI